jgi:hypothetical protein
MSFEEIEKLAEEVNEGKIGLAEAILSLPEDFSDCDGEMIEAKNNE